MESKSKEEMTFSFDALVLTVNTIHTHYKIIKAEAHVTPGVLKIYNQHLQMSCKFPFITYPQHGQLLLWTNQGIQYSYLCLTENQEKKVQQKVVKTLQVLHGVGFVHRDFRNTNILIDLE